ncbi:MAG: pyridoxamine 5'-phosphate oxidase family protein [Actinomycetota bacterium]|nr:pyridoxamine 5'-phosphate oxidase family protein [Actinomycetota bacterium]
METDPTKLEVLEEEECRALLADTQVGRVGVVVGGQPLVFPVNYVFDGNSVIVRTAVGTMLSGASLGLVAFEIDGIDAASRGGWSVMVQGVGHEVSDALDLTSERLQGVEVLPWAPGAKPLLLRIDAKTITGRRFGGEPVSSPHAGKGA